MAEPIANSTEEAREQELANLVSRLADRMQRGDQPELEQECSRHPEFADDLRELWGMLVVTRAAGQETGSIASRAQQPVDAPVLKLPFQMGDYLLQSEIGRGGMGVVYHAIRGSDGKAVAIKMLLKGDFATSADRKRFVSEAEAAARLNHPHIIPIYETGEHNGRPFFCMKLIEGQPLSSRLANGPMPARRAAQVMAQISDAIHYAHQNGVLHRDLKPSNVMLDDEGAAYIADFGLAKQFHDAGSLTRSGAILGTPSYMAPEQAAGNRGEVSMASDVYSLGAILYHMLAGHPPFLGASPVDTVLMVLEQNVISPRALNQRANRDLEMIAMRCLQKPQDLRFESAEQLAADIKRFLDNDPISAANWRLSQLVGNVFRETHHAEVLEHWGLLWIWHSLILLVVSVGTNVLFWCGNRNRLHYWLMWTLGMGAWAVVFWIIRRRMGPVMFVERQMAHVWAAAMCCVVALYPLESVLNLEVLSLAPLLAVIAGMVFLIKAGILSGSFYVQTVVMFATSIVMALSPDYALIWFGIASGACFFFAGLKYYRKRLRQSEPAM
jgi:serine/threonine-protein kinase